MDPGMWGWPGRFRPDPIPSPIPVPIPAPTAVPTAAPVPIPPRPIGLGLLNPEPGLELISPVEPEPAGFKADEPVPIGLELNTFGLLEPDEPEPTVLEPVEPVPLGLDLVLLNPELVLLLDSDDLDPVLLPIADIKGKIET